MVILGHGVDLVEVSRIKELLDAHGDRFIGRCFTATEAQYAATSAVRAQHLAARFAAKEAVSKALGTGISQGIMWTDIEVVRLPSGAPQVRLYNRALAVAEELGVKEWRLSLSHIKSHAMASAIAVG